MNLPELRKALSVKQRQALSTVAVLGSVMLIIIFGLYISDPQRKQTDARAASRAAAKEVLKDYRTPGQGIDPAEVWMARSEARLRDMQQHNEDLSRQLAQLKDQVDRSRETKSTFPFTPPPLPSEAANPPAALPAPPNRSAAFPKTPLPPPPVATAAAVVPVTPSTAAAPNVARIMDVALITSSPPVETPASNAVPTIENSLPVGAFTSAVLLNGLDAPTGGLAKTNPIPVLMRLLNNGTLPNHFHSRIKDCFVSGAGYGDSSAERAYIRLERLSCVMRDGRILDAGIEGYIAGEDGKNGLRGPVVSKQGQMIARALFAGIASGLGQSIAQSYSSISTSPLGSVQTVDPGDLAKVGVATGFGKALEKIADFYIARANELYPVIEIDSNRRGDVVLNKLVTLGPEFATAWADE